MLCFLFSVVYNMVARERFQRVTTPKLPVGKQTMTMSDYDYDYDLSCLFFLCRSLVNIDIFFISEYSEALQADSMSRERNCGIFYLHDQNSQKQTGPKTRQ